MGAPLAIFLLIAVVAIGYLVWSAINGNRSLVLPLVAFLLASIAALGAWHAWGESQSLPWTLGYLTIAVGVVLAAATGWVRGKNSVS